MAPSISIIYQLSYGVTNNIALSGQIDTFIEFQTHAQVIHDPSVILFVKSHCPVVSKSE
jgi:hypothetical protein